MIFPTARILQCGPCEVRHRKWTITGEDASRGVQKECLTQGVDLHSCEEWIKTKGEEAAFRPKRKLHVLVFTSENFVYHLETPVLHMYFMYQIKNIVFSIFYADDHNHGESRAEKVEQFIWKHIGQSSTQTRRDSGRR